MRPAGFFVRLRLGGTFISIDCPAMPPYESRCRQRSPRPESPAMGEKDPLSRKRSSYFEKGRPFAEKELVFAKRMIFPGKERPFSKKDVLLAGRSSFFPKVSSFFRKLLLFRRRRYFLSHPRSFPQPADKIGRFHNLRGSRMADRRAAHAARGEHDRHGSR